MTRETLLVTGANGFVGAHVAEIAAGRGLRVWATGREPEPAKRLSAFCDEYFPRDLSAGWGIPPGASMIIHLAGLAAVGPSFDEPQHYISVNSSAMTHMCESLLRSDTRPRLVVVSSGSVYAAPDGSEGSLSESSPLGAGSPYVVSKRLVETQSSYYANRGIDTVVARPFNHIGPGQRQGFLVPDLTRSVRLLPHGETLNAANLHAARDFTDVRDVARAYLTLAEAPTHRHQTYNVASGVAHDGFDVLATICKILDRPTPDVHIDPARMRPTDPLRITGNAERLRAEFGWQPEISWRQSIADFLDDVTDNPEAN